MQIQRLFLYPIKSLLPIEVDEAVIDEGGFRFDRQFVLVQDPEPDTEVAGHLTIKTTSELCLFRQSVDKDWTELKVSHIKAIDRDDLRIPLNPREEFLQGARTFAVEIFGTKVQCWDMGAEAQQFFSQHLEKPVRLLYIGPTGHRDVPAPSLVPKVRSTLSWVMGETVHPQKIRFNDAAPLLITTTASEEDARARLPKESQNEDIITRFRPNIHITSDKGDAPYSEDDWKRFTVQTESCTVQLHCVFRTVRCMSLNVDFESGGLVPTERQLYKLLAKDRRVNPAFPHKPCFGQYAFASPLGVVLRVGNSVEVIT